MLGSHAPMQTGRYKLIRHSEGRPFYADVTVQVKPVENGPQVEVSNSAFSWLKREYDSDAWGWALCEDFRAGAIHGVQFALANTKTGPAMKRYSVTVTEIQTSVATGTCPKSVAFAACYATWQALHDAGRNEPKIVDRQIVFAD